jgi:hypothetical protein
MKHQCFKVLPWWIKTTVLRRKIGPCPSLWSFEGHVDNDKEFVDVVRRQSEALAGGRRRSSIADKIANRW